MGGTAWTGGVMYLRNLCDVLLRHPHTRVEPIVVMPVDAPATIREAFTSVSSLKLLQAPARMTSGHYLRWLRAGVVGSDKDFERWCDSEGIDVVFEAAEYFGRKPRRAVLAWVPDLQHRQYPEMFGSLAWWKREVGIQAQVHSNRLVMLSSRAAEIDFHKYYPGSAGRTVIVRFAVPPAVNATPDPEVVTRYGLPRRFFYLPNQFWKHKNHIGIVEALALLRDHTPDIVIAASGNPSDLRHPGHFENLSRRVAELRLDQMFRVLGMIPYADVRQLIQLSAAVINPSLVEGWSTTVEEAKTLGAPLILSSIPVHREQAGDTAMYFDPTDFGNIAEILELAWHRFQHPGDEARVRAAVPAATQRVQAFADAFSAVVNRVRAAAASRAA
jgi:glycosyltransferase involved in cell wall biosynthesis